jgi:group I intron endonuclease
MVFQTNKGIYKIMCLATGKFYIGSSNNLNKRKSIHFSQLRNKNHANAHLQNAFNKYGADNFIFDIIIFLPESTTKQEIVTVEQTYIDELKAYNPDIGYNICKIAGQPGDRTGFKHSEETLNLFSEQRKGKKKSEEFKQILSEMYKGKSMKERTENSEWTSNKKGKSMKEITNNPNWTDSRIGRSHTTEAIQKMSESKRGENNPVYGKTWNKREDLILAQTGENNHMFGKTGESHHGFNPELITLINKQGEHLSQSRFYWRSIKVDINALLNKQQTTSKGWKLLN